MPPIEEGGCRERLITHHGTAGLDCSVLILSFRCTVSLTGIWRASGLGLGRSLAAGPSGEGLSGAGGKTGQGRRARVGRPGPEDRETEEFQAQGQGGGSLVSYKVVEMQDLTLGLP